MSATTTAPIVATKARVTVTVGATTSQHLFMGKFNVKVKNEVTMVGPYLGNTLKYAVEGGQETAFDLEGTMTPRGGDTGTDAFNSAIIAAYFAKTKPDTLVLETLDGEQFTFNKATTAYTDYEYEHDAEKGVSFKASGIGPAAVADGASV